MSNQMLDEINEEELARFYQEHKGDLSLWQKTPRRMRRHRGEGPTTSFAVRPHLKKSKSYKSQRLGVR